MLLKQDFIYTPVGQNRPLHIYLPNGYETSGERYPVMYFFDGHNLFLDEDATFGKSWGLAEFLNGWDKPMIIVGMECGHGENERLSEYLPYGVKSGMFGGLSPMGEATMQWIRNEVKPYIDQNFRTWAHREATAIAGASMGGLMALYGLVRHNDVFGKGACVSSSLFFCLPQVMADMRSCRIDEDTKAYLSWGTKEARAKDIWKNDTSTYAYRANKAAANRFEEKGARVRLRCQLGGGHCEADWEKLVPEFMEFLWK